MIVPPLFAAEVDRPGSAAGGPVAAWGARQVVGLAVIGVLLAAASGCRLLRDDKGLFVDSRNDYLDAEATPPLSVPEELSGVRIVDSWPIPDIPPQPTTKLFPADVPRPEVLVGRDLDAVKIQKLGPQSWVVLGDAPEQVWPHVKQFLADSGVEVAEEDAPAGIVRTQWLVVGGEDHGDVVRSAILEGLAEQAAEDGDESAAPGRERLRLRVERGIRRGSSEVHVDHERALGLRDEVTGGMAAVEATVVAALAEFLAVGVSEPSVSMVGRAIAAASKAEMLRDETGSPRLRLNVSFERAWATIGQALERAEIKVNESDRAGAVYDITFPAAGNRGWLKRIVPGGESGRDADVAIVLERVSNEAESGGDAVVVRVEDPEGNATTPELAEAVLVTLREFAA